MILKILFDKNERVALNEWANGRPTCEYLLLLLLALALLILLFFMNNFERKADLQKSSSLLGGKQGAAIHPSMGGEDDLSVMTFRSKTVERTNERTKPLVLMR